MATSTEIKRDFRATLSGIIQLVIASGLIAVIALVLSLKTDVEIIKIRIEANVELKGRIQDVERRTTILEKDLYNLTNEERILHNKKIDNSQITPTK